MLNKYTVNKYIQEYRDPDTQKSESQRSIRTAGGLQGFDESRDKFKNKEDLERCGEYSVSWRVF